MSSSHTQNKESIYKYTSPKDLRSAIREESFTIPTSGQCPGYKQANMVILPKAFADDFEQFCNIEYPNKRGCPILEKMNAGDFKTKILAESADIRTDLPKYRIWRNGKLVEEKTNITQEWRDDFVTFLFGCSFSFEEALQKAGVPVRNIDQGKNVSMYKTSIKCQDYGSFKNVPLVVSMRPIPEHLVETAKNVTARFVDTHGAPVYCGNPSEIGISDINKVDFGESVEFQDGDVPCFWACGVTSTMAAIESGADIVITHSPGHMFVSDILDE